MSNEIEQNNDLSSQSFRVFVRIRPLSEKELNLIDKLYSNGRKERSYVFDDIYPETVNNQYIFESCIKQNVDNVLNGYNSTVFAYGITGTGKTHTIFGDLQKYIDFNSYDENLKLQYEMGICVYAIDYLFFQIDSSQDKNFNIKISYLEIYNEQVIDLLDEKSSNNLMIVEDIHKGIIVPDLNEFNVKSSKELIGLIMKGNSKRTMAATGENQFSSRSHAILQIVIEQKTKLRDLKEEILISKFLLVDLAGSERSGLEKGIRTHEGKNINKSLLSLGNCINILSDKSKKGAFVPYRDSKLTRLLKDSLAGNIMSVMIACVSPSPTCYDETVHTLKYALKAKKIEKSVHKNTKEVQVHISQYKDIIDSLKSEIEQLKQVIKKQQNINLLTGKQLNGPNDIDCIHLDMQNENPNDKNNSKINNNQNKNNKNDNNFFKTSGNENKDVFYNNNKLNDINNNTFKNSQIKNRININIGQSLEITNMKKNSFNNNKKISSQLSKENITQGSNIIMFSNNASLLSNQNYNNNNLTKINSTNNYVNKSNGRANSSVSRNNITYITKDNSNISNLSGNNQVLQNTLGLGNANSKTNTNNFTSGKNSSNFYYNKSNVKKSRKYSDLCRNNITNSNLVSSFNGNERNNNTSISPENNNHIYKMQKDSFNGNDNYLNYIRFIVKNGEDEYDLDEFARNVETLYNDKITFEELINKGSNDKIIGKRYKLIKDCFEKYLEIINDKLVENIEYSMVLKINIKEILDLNLLNNNNITNLNKQIYTLEKQSVDNPSKSTEYESEISKIKEEIKNIQIAIEDNDKTKGRISESLLKNENNKKALKHILIKLISQSESKNGSCENEYKSYSKDKEEQKKETNKYEKYLINVFKDKELKDNKLGEVLSEVDHLKRLLDEKEKQIKEFSQMQNAQNKLSEYADRDKIIAENITEEDISIRLSELKNLKRGIDDSGDKNNKLSNNVFSPNQFFRKESLTDEINNIRNNINNDQQNSDKMKQNFSAHNNPDLKDSKQNMFIHSNQDNPKLTNNLNINKNLYANPKKKISMPINVESKNLYNLKPQLNSGHNSSKNNSNNIHSYNSKNLSLMQGQKINPIQSDKFKKNKPNNINSNNIPNPNLMNNNLEHNINEEKQKNHNFIPISNNQKGRNYMGSVSRSPRNRVLNKDRERDINAIVNASKNKFKEFDRIIQSQLSDVGNNMIYKKPKDLNAKERKKFKNNSTDNTSAKIGSKKFPFFNHNGIFKYKNPNKRVLKVNSSNKLNIDNNINNNSIIISSEEDDIDNLNYKKIQKSNSIYNNNFDEPPSELDILQNLDKNFENPYKKPAKSPNNLKMKKETFIKNDPSEPIKGKEVDDVNNIFLNNYEEINSKNTKNNHLVNEFGIDRNLLEISEIFSSNHDKNLEKNKKYSNNQKNFIKQNTYNKNWNLNDDLTLILSPKAVEGVYPSVNSSNVEFKSNLFFDKNTQKSYTPDNSRLNFFENNSNNNQSEININNTNVFPQHQLINKNGAKNTLLYSHESQGFKENLMSNLISNPGNNNYTSRINNVNVQKFINIGNSLTNKGISFNNNINYDNANIFENNLYLNDNNKLVQNNPNNMPSYEVSASKYINVPNSANEISKEMSENYPKNKNEHQNFDILKNEIEQYVHNELNKNLNNYSYKKQINQSDFDKDDSSLTDDKHLAKNSILVNNNIANLNNNVNLSKNLNLMDFKINPIKENIEQIKNKQIENHKNFKEKPKYRLNSSDTELKCVKFKDLYFLDNLGQNSDEKNKPVDNHNIKTNEKQINLLKQARLERQTNKRSESCGNSDNNIDLLIVNKEQILKQNNYSNKPNDIKDNFPGPFNSNADSNNLETKGFNKNTVDFINDYKKNKISSSNFKTGEILVMSNNFISCNNTNNFNYCEKDIHDLNSNLALSNKIDNYKNTNSNNDYIQNQSENFIYNNNTNPNRFGSNFKSNNYDNRKNPNIIMTNNYEINSNHLKKQTVTANNKNLELDVVDEKSYDVIDEDRMTIEDEMQRNNINSKNPKLLNFIENK